MKTLYIGETKPWPHWRRVSWSNGFPWENGFNERFNAKRRDEFLNTEIFYRLKKAEVPIERVRQHDNTRRPHGALGYGPPAARARMTGTADPAFPSKPFGLT